MADWKERDKTRKLEIEIGDKTYYPEYFDPVKEVSLHTVALEFNNIHGAKVVSGKLGYRKFNMKLVFHGSDHLEQEQVFEAALYDENEWLITHPYYGKIVGRPAKYSTDNSKLGISSVNVEVWETITDRDLTAWEKQINIYEVPAPPVEAIPDVKKLSKIQKIVAVGASTIATTQDAINNVTDAVDRCDRYINTLGTGLQAYMASIEYLVRAPGRIYDTAVNRIANVRASYDSLASAVTGLNTQLNNVRDAAIGVMSREDKILFENIGHNSMLAMVDASTLKKSQLAAENGIADVESEQSETRAQIEHRITSLIDMYSAHLSILGKMHSKIDNQPDSYYPDYESVYNLQTLVYRAVAEMLRELNGATTEKVMTLTRPMGLVPLVYEMTGTTDSETVQDFAEMNSLTMDELILVPEGREVTYAQR